MEIENNEQKKKILIKIVYKVEENKIDSHWGHSVRIDY